MPPPNSASAGGAEYGRIGNSIPRVEDWRLLTGQGRYTDDVVPSGCSYLAFVRSPHAPCEHPCDRYQRRAQAAGRDRDDRRRSPGGRREANPQSRGIRSALAFPSFTDDLVIPPWRALAIGKARHVGEAVALVVAPTESGARDAAEAVQVDYDPLTPVIEIEDAEKTGAPLVWDEIRGNRLFAIEAGDQAATEAAFARAAEIVEIEVVNNRVIINFMEPRGCIASYDPGDAAASGPYRIAGCASASDTHCPFPQPAA